MVESSTAIETELASALTVLLPEGHTTGTELLAQVLITAGPENWDAASAADSTVILPVGLQSPGEWHAVSGAPHPDLAGVIRTDGATEVVIAFTGIETNTITYDAAAALGSYLTRQGAKSVRFAKLAGMSVELELETITDTTQRAAYLDRLFAGADKSPGRRPAATKDAAPAKRPSIAPTVDMASGQIYSGPADSREVLLEAGARRLRTVTVYDDLRDPGAKKALHLHDLEITVMTPAGLRSYEVLGVRDADLVSPRRWLNRVPGGTSIAVATGAHVLRAIEGAIRAHDADLVLESSAFRRTGWKEINGQWGYLSTSGFMTADGLSDIAVSVLSERMSNIAYPDTADRSQEVDAAINTLDAFSELTLPNLYVGPWGGIIHNVAGLGHGGARAVVAVQGAKGSGKTTVVAFMAAHASAAFTTNLPMATVDGSPANLGRLGAGLESAFICIDDARKRTSLKKAEAEAEGIERILRMGYAGGSARYTVSEFDTESQTWNEGLPDLASPMVVLSGETLPAGDENGASSRERIYPVQIPKGHQIFHSGNARAFVELSENGLPEKHMAFFIRWCAGMIESMGGMDAWTDYWRAAEQLVVDRMAHLPVSIRVREVAAVVETGFQVWLHYLYHIGVLEVKVAAHHMKGARATVAANALEHGTLNVQLTTGTEYEAILATLRSAIVGRQGYLRYLAAPFDDSTGTQTQAEREQELESDHSRFGARLVGVQKQGRASASGDGEIFLAMQPSDLLALLHRVPQFRGMTESELTKSFEDVSIRDGVRLTKTVQIDGQRVKCIAIPWSTWTGDDDGDAENTSTEMAA